MFSALCEFMGSLVDLLHDGMESIIKIIMKKHFLIRLPVVFIILLLWLILFPIYIVGCICTELSIDTELFLIYFFCAVWLVTITLYPHEIPSADEEQHEWIKENLKRWTYILFFDKVHLMNVEDAMAFKLRWL